MNCISQMSIDAKAVFFFLNSYVIIKNSLFIFSKGMNNGGVIAVLHDFNNLENNKKIINKFN